MPAFLLYKAINHANKPLPSQTVKLKIPYANLTEGLLAVQAKTKKSQKRSVTTKKNQIPLLPYDKLKLGPASHKNFQPYWRRREIAGEMTDAQNRTERLR